MVLNIPDQHGCSRCGHLFLRAGAEKLWGLPWAHLPSEQSPPLQAHSPKHGPCPALPDLPRMAGGCFWCPWQGWSHPTTVLLPGGVWKMLCRRYLLVNVGEPEFLLAPEKNKAPVRRGRNLVLVSCSLLTDKLV